MVLLRAFPKQFEVHTVGYWLEVLRLKAGYVLSGLCFRVMLRFALFLIQEPNFEKVSRGSKQN